MIMSIINILINKMLFHISFVMFHYVAKLPATSNKGQRKNPKMI